MNHGTTTGYAAVVKDLATQRIQPCPCKTKTSQETEKSLRMFLEPSDKPTVTCTDKLLEKRKYCKDLSWNHRTSTPLRSEAHGKVERAVRRAKEGISAVLLQSMECYCCLRNVQNLLADGKTSHDKRFGKPVIETGARVECHLIFHHEINQDFINLASKNYQESFLGLN